MGKGLVPLYWIAAIYFESKPRRVNSRMKGGDLFVAEWRKRAE
jgi:hypothetical protein